MQPGQIKSSGVVQDIGRIGWDYNHWTLSLGSDFPQISEMLWISPFWLSGIFRRQ